MIDSCGECRRLWREYAEATTAHVQLDNKLRLAALTGDCTTVQVLAPQTEKAQDTRILLREIIRAHDFHSHGEAAAAG